MTQYLVVAHKTLVGSALLDEVSRRLEAGPNHFHLIVPVDHPSDHAWSKGECEAEAAKRLDEGLAAFAELGAEATGEIGDQNPVAAIAAVVRVRDVDEIILSTLPPGPSRWLKLDVISRARDRFDVPITHVVASREPAQ
jgi:hypothetical protein